MYIVKIVPKQGLYNQKRNTMKRFPSKIKDGEIFSSGSLWQYKHEYRLHIELTVSEVPWI